ncbi:MAG: DUF1934 domain-containing protein [Loktanella sp.]|nr:DUF1934 domain-containing protein [Loktanella sp.]
MERYMLVKVVSRSRYEGDSEVMTFTGKGLLRETEQGFRLRYTASDENGAKTASDVTVENGVARLRLLGESGYTMVLDPQNPTETPIATDVGVLRIRVVTNRFDWRLDAEQGAIDMDYTLLTQGTAMSDMSVSIEMRNE